MLPWLTFRDQIFSYTFLVVLSPIIIEWDWGGSVDYQVQSIQIPVDTDR
jgi:hypothetical protein